MRRLLTDQALALSSTFIAAPRRSYSSPAPYEASSATAEEMKDPTLTKTS